RRGPDHLPEHVPAQSDVPRLSRALGLEVAERVDRRPVEPDLKVQMRAGAEACAPDVADQLTLVDRFAARDGDLRLVAVEGRKATPVVDHDEVAVAGHPA